jgi:hypothetical protein
MMAALPCLNVVRFWGKSMRPDGSISGHQVNKHRIFREPASLNQSQHLGFTG